MTFTDTASETFVHHKKFRAGSIFGVFTSVACILIGKDGEYETKTPAQFSDSLCNDLNNTSSNFTAIKKHNIKNTEKKYNADMNKFFLLVKFLQNKVSLKIFQVNKMS